MEKSLRREDGMALMIVIISAVACFIARTHNLEQALQTQVPADRPYLQAPSGASGVFRIERRASRRNLW